MKRCILPALLSTAVLLLTAGCDMENLSSAAKTLLTAKNPNPAGVGDLLQIRQQLRLQDGTGTGDGNQYGYGGAPGNGPGPGSSTPNGSNGQGGGTQNQYQDGSCGNGG
ncbi:MAG: hypothetical protein IPM18_02565 [Phycisphaerales bacterium]|nr:hypothetical protein [Phycisphaerales bacterium]